MGISAKQKSVMGVRTQRTMRAHPGVPRMKAKLRLFNLQKNQIHLFQENTGTEDVLLKHTHTEPAADGLAGRSSACWDIWHGICMKQSLLTMRKRKCLEKVIHTL